MVTHTEIEVRVEHFRINLLRVDFPGGHHIVIGGRLVSSTEGDKTTPHPDMPEYTQDMFPAPLDKWGDGEFTDVHVSVRKNTPSGTMKPIGVVRACTLLFTARDKRVVADWIRSQA